MSEKQLIERRNEMERTSSNNAENEVRTELETADGWGAWEAVPRDGPAVFVVDTDAFDQGLVRGRWLDVSAGQTALHQALSELLGQEPKKGRWAIVDQIGLGGLMAPETMTIPELSTVADYLATEAGQ
jgi:hypothetical protein